MDMQVLSALAGTLVGVTATSAIAWINQKMLTRRELIRDEFRMRQALYGEFIAECARLLVDAFQHSLEKPDTFVPVYSLINRIRLCASQAVLTEAEQLVQRISEQYFSINLSGAAPARAFRRIRCAEDVRRGLPGGAQVAAGATLECVQRALGPYGAHFIPTECRRFADHSPVASTYAEPRQ